MCLLDAEFMKFRVKVFLPSGDPKFGHLSYTVKGPKLADDKEREFSTNQSGIHLSIINPGSYDQISSIFEKDRFEFAGTIFTKKYNKKGNKKYDLYPPSTSGWATHLSREGTDIRISIQKMINDSRYLLSCVDCEDESLIRFHPIREYEANILTMESDWDFYGRIFGSQEPEKTSLTKLLQAPAPPWPALAKLVEGINVPNFQRYETVKETLSQLVPENYSEKIREELMVFLAWTTRVTIPTEDPQDYLESVEKRFKSGLLRGLVFGHIHCLIQEIEPPKYVRILALASRELLASSMAPTTEELTQDNWSNTWYKLMEMFPDRKSRIIDLIESLTLNQEIHTSMPVSRQDAKSSSEAWLNRFALLRSSISLRGYVQDKRIGLEKLVYIGGAHRWPHKHLQYTARLGNLGQKPPYIQFMILPKPAVERLMRVRQNIAKIDWSASRLNFNLYDRKSESWKCNLSHFTKSFQSTRSMKQLNKEFNLNETTSTIPISEVDARILGLLSWGMNIQVLEKGTYDPLLQASKSNLKERIRYLLDQGLIQIQYIPAIHGLATICLDAKGDTAQLRSIARASLKHLPSSTALISEDKKSCFVMARVPEEQAYEILVDLPRSVTEYGITMKGYRVSAYAGYLRNLYQRLRNPDGTWDDDVSGFLSQIRS